MPLKGNLREIIRKHTFENYLDQTYAKHRGFHDLGRCHSTKQWPSGINRIDKVIQVNVEIILHKPMLTERNMYAPATYLAC